MKKIVRAAALIGGVLAGLAWFRSKKQKRDAGEGTLLLDDSATPAPYALSPLQERPVFEADEHGRPFATVEDLDARDDSVSVGSKPLTIDESKAEG